MKRIALTLMVGLSSLCATPASAVAEEKPVVTAEESKDADGGGEVGALSCNIEDNIFGSLWVQTGSCLGGSIRYRQRYVAYCDGEYVWGAFWGPIICSNNPPVEQ